MMERVLLNLVALGVLLSACAPAAAESAREDEPLTEGFIVQDVLHEILGTGSDLGSARCAGISLTDAGSQPFTLYTDPESIGAQVGGSPLGHDLMVMAFPPECLDYLLTWLTSSPQSFTQILPASPPLP